MHRSTRNIAMCSLNDAINLPVSLRPRLLMFCRCHGTSGTLVNVLASWKDKRCAELPLPSYAIAVHSIPTTASTSVDSVVNVNVQVHVAKQIEVCKMEDLGESVVWREAMGRGAIKTFLEAHKEVFDLEEEVESVVVRLRSSTHGTDQNQRSAASSPPSITNCGVGGGADKDIGTQVWSYCPP